MEPAPAPVLALKASPTRGFTLVEMLVVLAIIAIITAISTLGQSNFNKSLLLTDTAYGIAFSARQAQTFGLSSRNFGTAQNAGYGIHFDGSLPDRYVVFADTSKALQPIAAGCPQGTAGYPDAKPGNCRYDTQSGNADGIVTTYQFSRGFKVKRFCGMQASARFCSDDPTPVTALDVVFTRPNTTTTMTGSYQSASPKKFDCAEVTLTDSTGTADKTVRFSSLGEIAIGQSCQ